MKFVAILGVAAALATTPAYAVGTVVLSGDSNIFSLLSTPGNTLFMSRLGGTKVLIRTSGSIGFASQSADIQAFYAARGVTATVISSSTAITSSLLSGVNLFIAPPANDPFTAAEVAALGSHVAAGGRMLLAGEFARRANGTPSPSGAAINTNINTLLADLGNPMRLSLTTIPVAGAAFGTVANVNALTAGIASIGYAATTEARGGLTLFNSAQGLSFITATGVPEPMSWAMLIAGFGLTGAAMRRRRAVAC